ncbi:MAG: TorF family putative porin [Sphingomonadales bacterium]|nr:TorF family putative porin [Sphingomonadales bacterium]
MNSKFLCAVAALVCGFASEAAFADGTAPAPTPEFTVTGDGAIVSQYRFRGLASSDNLPAVQASFTVTDKSGFYLSFWGSSGSGDKGDLVTGGTTGNFYISPKDGTEIDIYGGYSHTLAKSGITLDGGLYGYIYPNRVANNLFEVYGDLSKTYGPVSVKVGLNWAPAQHYFTLLGPNVTHYSMYEYGNISYTPAKVPALTFHAELGHTGGGLDYVKEYIDYTVGVGYKWKALTFDISLVGTNISRGDAANYIAATGGCTGQSAVYCGNATNSVYRVGKFVPVGSITAAF